MKNRVHNFLKVLVCYFAINPLLAQAEFIEIKQNNKLLELSAEQVTFTAILDKITATTGVVIHHALLPQQLLSLHCKCQTLSQLVDCIFAQQANTVLRFSRHGKQLAELWILNTQFTPSTPSVTYRTDTQTLTPSTDMQQLIALTKTGKAANRADAVIRLARQAKPQNNAARQALTAALSDPDASVRVQAVAALANTEGEQTTKALQIALSDVDVSVRLMAVDSAGNNIAVLQQASMDTNETVRTYAMTKLIELKTLH